MFFFSRCTWCYFLFMNYYSSFESVFLTIGLHICRRVGRLCSQCFPGFYPSLLSARCRPINDCNDSAIAVLILLTVVGIAAAVAALSVWLKRAPVSSKLSVAAASFGKEETMKASAATDGLLLLLSLFEAYQIAGMILPSQQWPILGDAFAIFAVFLSSLFTFQLDKVVLLSPSGAQFQGCMDASFDNVSALLWMNEHEDSFQGLCFPYFSSEESHLGLLFAGPTLFIFVFVIVVAVRKDVLQRTPLESITYFGRCPARKI